MAGRDTGDEVGGRAADAIGPELGLLADSDPALFGAAMGRSVAAALLHPFALGAAVSRYAAGLVTATAASAARAVGLPTDGWLQPADGDRRFADPAWSGNPLYAWRLQRYLLLTRLFDDIVESATLDGAGRQKAQLVWSFLADALAPTNFLWSNPAALKHAFDTGGASVARGAANLAHDLLHNRGMPRQVDASAFELGRDLAATPGQVVFRNHIMELIQYAPQTDRVHAVPLLFSPPWINKYYIMDLAPDRSFVEWAVRHGHTCFAISYRNPDASMADVGLDDYLLHGPKTAIDVVRDITGADRVNIGALCLGGTLTVMLLAQLAASGDDRVNSITLLNTLVDFSEPGPLGAFTDEQTIAKLERRMRREGVLQGASMRGTFDALRANDLIFNYVVSNWLMGEDPPAFDILAWNADSTNMPAKMHAFYLRSCYLRNQLAQGELELDGVRLNLEKIESDVFIVGARNDHIAPWRSSYRTTQILANADVRFVLSSAGHIAGIVNPPGPKARLWTRDDTPPSADDWLAGAVEEQRSWWELWALWAGERAGDQVEPPAIGNERHRPLGDAPGRYVRNST